MRGAGNARRQRGQNTLASFNQRHVQSFVSQTFVAVAVQLFHRIVQLGRQLNAGRAAADDGDIHLAVRPEVRRILEEQIQHFLMETTRLMRIIEEDAVLFHARRVEVVRRTSQRHDQRVVRQLTLGHQQLALLVMQLGEGDRFGFTVNIHHRSQLELEVVVTGVSKIAQRVYTFIK